jgi:hypothetical protein
MQRVAPHCDSIFVKISDLYPVLRSYMYWNFFVFHAVSFVTDLPIMVLAIYFDK